MDNAEPKQATAYQEKRQAFGEKYGVPVTSPREKILAQNPDVVDLEAFRKPHDNSRTR